MSNTNLSRRKAMGAMAGMAACIPCAVAFSQTKTQSNNNKADDFHQRINDLVKKIICKNCTLGKF